MDSRNFHINKRPNPSLALEELRSERKIIRYKECLKNHAAAIGGNATDGCGEFMAAGDEGTPEALKCSACNCHRNFHRKEIQSDSDHCPSPYYLSPLLPSTAQNPSDQSDEDGVREVEKPAVQTVRKRFRTKFSQEQKEKMLRFAEKAGWSIQKLEESVVQQVCQEVGIKRRVLKVWMHNNKNSLAKRNSPPPS